MESCNTEINELKWILNVLEQGHISNFNDIIMLYLVCIWYQKIIIDIKKKTIVIETINFIGKLQLCEWSSAN